jgi:hypothetical protein
MKGSDNTGERTMKDMLDCEPAKCETCKEKDVCPIKELKPLVSMRPKDILALLTLKLLEEEMERKEARLETTRRVVWLLLKAHGPMHLSPDVLRSVPENYHVEAKPDPEMGKNVNILSAGLEDVPAKPEDKAQSN